MQAQQRGLRGGLVQRGPKGESPVPSPAQEAADLTVPLRFISVIFSFYIKTGPLSDLSR